MTQNYDLSGAPSRLSSLIDQIRSAVPDAAIVVASLPRNSDNETLRRIQDFNAQIPGIVASKGSMVSFLDAFAAIDPVHLAADGTHLTHNGYGRLAAAWYPALHAILNTLAPPTPTTTASPPPVSCSPRPRVLVSTAKSGAGQLTATIEATGPGNGLRELRIGDARNAIVDVVGQSGAGSFTVALPGTPSSVTLLITRDRNDRAVHVPLVVVDQCGDWHTFVGGGLSAF
jgi:hypothetical protein